ncbi:hypothetical protein OG413_32250 [Streptomyces sp. NBC_01433]|uniref:sacsin N-terminal ATP-binding-like domain-containing protein n=1 Tax=Streptomyces sp. NBC_01433 TaxID=2903864 RepID=UPI0022590605|nr:hypothetical protein [Streptomyces sp. NBC_01433]MCX4679899.1 hypothetical protein [Streptomyces sp. NBC_01433]
MGASMVVPGTAEEIRAARWAERLFRKTVPAGRTVPEPRGPGAVCAAVETIARLAAGAGVMQDSVTGARRGAKRMSTDRLQGLSEVVQNAEDLGASEVRFLVRERTLLAAHNGRPVRLTDVIPLSMPWVTSKAQDAEATGRFGIGLMTLFTFSPSIEVHSGHYRLRIAESGVGLAPSRTFPPHVGGDGWTVFRVPLTDAPLTAADVDAWLSAWGNEALLFLRRSPTWSISMPGAGYGSVSPFTGMTAGPSPPTSPERRYAWRSRRSATRTGSAGRSAPRP